MPLTMESVFCNLSLHLFALFASTLPTLLAASFCDEHQILLKAHSDITQRDMPTSDYLEFNRKTIEKVVAVPNEKSTANGYFIENYNVYFSNSAGNAKVVLDGYPDTTSSNKVVFHGKSCAYIGTNDGLYKVKHGKTKARKIDKTTGIKIDFGAIDNNGYIYFGTDGENTRKLEALYVLKDDELINIDGIQQTLGSYPTVMYESNKIAVDSKNNVYVVAFSDHVYLLRPCETKVIEINGIDAEGGVSSVVIDKKDNAYFRTNTALYVLKHNDNVLSKIIVTDDIFESNYFLAIDDDDNVYFKINNENYALKSEKISFIEIFSQKSYIDTNIINDNIVLKGSDLYFLENGKPYVLRQNEIVPASVTSGTEEVFSLAVDNNGNIYILFRDNGRTTPFVIRKNSKVLIKIDGVSGSLSHVFADNSNNVYVASGNGLFKLRSGQRNAKKIKVSNSQISSLVFDKNNNAYFATDYDGSFLLRNNEWNGVKIDGINNQFGSYVEVYKDKKYDVIYFKTGGALYMLNGGDHKLTTIILKQSPDMYASDKNRNIYYKDDSNHIYVLKNGQSLPDKINGINEHTNSIETDSNNNVYFITNNAVYALTSGDTEAINIFEISNTVATFSCSEHLCLMTNTSIYVIEDRKILTLLELNETARSGHYKIVQDNLSNFYFFTESSLSKLKMSSPLSDVIKEQELNALFSNKDETILNTVNFFNQNADSFLNLRKVQILNKTASSAKIKGVAGKYDGEVDIKFSIVDEDKSSNTDLSDLLKKSIYFNFIEKQMYSIDKIKSVKSVNTENLSFGDIEVTRNDSLKWGVKNFKNNVCLRERTNTSPVRRPVKLPKCEYTQISKFVFEIIKGLEFEENRKEFSQEEKDKAAEFVSLKFQNKAIVHKFSKDLDLSNLAKQEFETQSVFTDSEDEYDLVPNEKVTVSYLVRENVYESTVNLKQPITGFVIGKIVQGNGEEQTTTLSINEAMQILQKYSLLPQTISVNEDDSVEFVGKAVLSLTSDGTPKQKLKTEIIKN